MRVGSHAELVREHQQEHGGTRAFGGHHSPAEARSVASRAPRAWMKLSLALLAGLATAVLITQFGHVREGHAPLQAASASG